MTSTGRRTPAPRAAGRTWARSPARVRSFAFDPSGHTIFAGTTKGVFRSEDRGATWKASGPTGESLVAISPGYAKDGTIFSGSQDDLFVSRDRGETWQREALPATGTVEAVAVSPAYTTDGTVLVSIGGQGLYKSTDDGRTFAPTGADLIGGGHVIADFTNPTGTPIQFSPAYAQDRTIFAYASQDVVRSTDGGSSWKVLHVPSAEQFLPNVGRLTTRARHRASTRATATSANGASRHRRGRRSSCSRSSCSCPVARAAAGGRLGIVVNGTARRSGSALLAAAVLVGVLAVAGLRPLCRWDRAVREPAAASARADPGSPPGWIPRRGVPGAVRPGARRRGRRPGHAARRGRCRHRHGRGTCGNAGDRRAGAGPAGRRGHRLASGGRRDGLVSDFWAVPPFIALKDVTVTVDGVARPLGTSGLHYHAGTPALFTDPATHRFDGLNATNRAFSRLSTRHLGDGPAALCRRPRRGRRARRDRALLDLGVRAINWGVRGSHQRPRCAPAAPPLRREDGRRLRRHPPHDPVARDARTDDVPARVRRPGRASTVPRSIATVAASTRIATVMEKPSVRSAWVYAVKDSYGNDFTHRLFMRAAVFGLAVDARGEPASCGPTCRRREADRDPRRAQPATVRHQPGTGWLRRRVPDVRHVARGRPTTARSRRRAR